MMSLSKKIESLRSDLTIKKGTEPTETEKLLFTAVDRRIIVGPLYTATKNSTPSLLRFSAEHNLDDDEFPFDSITPEHPLFPMRLSAWELALSAISIAGFAMGDDVDQLERCIRADFGVACTPNFQHSGLVAAFTRRIMSTLFDQQPTPVVTVVGSSALPGAALISASYEFLAIKSDD